jgi:small nuclear ribonucleoprotein G
VNLQGNRKVSGVLRGYDIFLNIVLDEAVEEQTPAQKKPIGTVVSLSIRLVLPLLSFVFSTVFTRQVIRGNSINSLETLEATR